jgi:hypothetical protein
MKPTSNINPRNDNPYLELPLKELRVEIFRKELTFEKVGFLLGKSGRQLTKATISYVLNDKSVLTNKAKERIRKRICNLLARIDKRKAS